MSAKSVVRAHLPSQAGVAGIGGGNALSPPAPKRWILARGSFVSMLPPFLTALDRIPRGARNG
jgi:hypothetical protein